MFSNAFKTVDSVVSNLYRSLLETLEIARQSSLLSCTTIFSVILVLKGAKSGRVNSSSVGCGDGDRGGVTDLG